MLRNGGLGNPEFRLNRLPYSTRRRLLVVPQELEDAPPDRIADNRERVDRYASPPSATGSPV